VRAAALAALLVASACARSREDRDAATVPATSTELGPVTLEGRAVRVGPDPVSWMALTLADGSQRRLLGVAADPLCSVLGATVSVQGTQETDGLRVASFRVVEVNRQLVDDGTIVVTTAGAALRLPNGATRDIPNAPGNLAAAAGSRAWVSHPISGVAPSFGVIAATCR
jgi:hypothetical protein